MKNDYKIIDFSVVGLPFVEAYGDIFSYKDLYELVGRQQFMTTFNFKTGTEAHTKFGENVTGVIYYDYKILSKLRENSFEDDSEFTEIKISSPTPSLSVENVSDLKYGGIKISDIDFISFLSYRVEAEMHSTGEKKVPNIVEVPVDCDLLPEK